MPISDYYKGHGEDVMRKMKKEYGSRADSIFYATANRRKMRPTDSRLKRSMRSALRGRQRGGDES
jgi:hypothetical protein